ncbi:MAG: CAP domain-containing protein [Desulfatirhabdiaceae bacterium]
MPTRIILSEEGDIEREKELIRFAQLRQAVLHNLMSFQNLKQDQTRCELTDGSVIKIKSCFGQDQIDIYSPALTVEAAPLIECEAEVALDNTLYFFVMNRAGGLYRVERYVVGNISSNPVAVFDGVLELKEEVGIDHSSRTFVIAGSTDTNSVIVDCRALYINGNPYPFASPPYEIPADCWPSAQMRVPIEKFNSTEYEIYEMGGGSRDDTSFSPNGSVFSRNSSTYPDPSRPYPYVGYSNNITANHIMSNAGGGVDFAIYEHIADSENHNIPYPSVVGSTYATSSCVCDEKLLIAVKNSNSPYSGHYIGEWDLSIAHGLCFWDSGPTPFLAAMTRRFIEFDQTYFYRIQQILYHDGILYVFLNGGVFWPPQNLEIKAYDFETSELIASRDFGVNGGNFTRASKINFKANTYLCVATVDSWVTETTSPVHFLDIETLETIYQVSIPVEYFDENFVAVNKPKADRMADHHNRIRHEWSAIYGTTWQTKLYYLGRSAVCEQVAREHLLWLLETGRNQHEEVNGDLVGVRALRHGLLMAGENIAFIMDDKVESGIDYLCDLVTGWPSSPNHYANMINRDYNQMGWACGVYPSKVKRIIIGPGTFKNGTYTTKEEIIPIPAKMIGRVRVYVVVFAG